MSKINPMNAEPISFDAFKALKKGDVVLIKVGDRYYKSQVVTPAFYNADADEPGWEIDTTNGFADQYSVYLPKSEPKKTMRTKKVLRFPVNNYVLAEMKQELRCRNVNSVYRADLMFDNVYDIVEKWIEEFNPNLVYNEKTNAMPYLESAICESDLYHCYLDLVIDERTKETDGKSKGYVLCRDMNGSEWELITKLGYLDIMNPRLRQIYTIKAMEICWDELEDQPDGYKANGLGSQNNV